MSVGAVNKQTGDRIPTAGMPAIDDALDLTSVNPVQNAVITAALALKQDKTDNSLQTTDKTVVGAVNELKSGLINYENQNDLNLEVPYRKNVLENTANSATVSGVLYTVNNDGSVSVSTETQSSNISSLQINDFTLPVGEYVLNGCPSGGGSNKYELQIAIGGATYRDYGGGVSFTSTNQRCVVQILIRSGVTINDTFYPMIRPATITDPTFAPYIPSVESRIETIEGGNISGLTLGKISHTRYAFNSANTSIEITIPTYKAYIGIAHHPWAENTGDIVIINSASAGNLGCYQTSNVFTITKSGNVLTFTNDAFPMYLDLYEITP